MPPAHRLRAWTEGGQPLWHDPRLDLPTFGPRIRRFGAIYGAARRRGLGWRRPDDAAAEETRARGPRGRCRGCPGRWQSLDAESAEHRAYEDVRRRDVRRGSRRKGRDYRLRADPPGTS